MGSILRVCIATILFFALSEYLLRALETKRRAFLKQTVIYETMFAQLSARLSSQAQELFEDRVLQSHLKSKLHHSVKKLLEAELRQESFDQVAVFDDACQLVAQAASGNVPTPSCEIGSTGGWGRSPMKEGAFLFLRKGFLLDDATYYMSMGKVIPAHPNDSLVSFPSFLRDRLRSPRPIRNPLLPILFVWACFAIFALYQLRKRERKEKEQNESFLQWCRERGAPNASGHLREAQALLRSQFEHSAAQMHALEIALDETQKKLGRAQQKLETTELQLSEVLPAAGLAQQITETGAYVHKMIVSFTDLTQELDEILDQGILPATHEMNELVQSWQKGIARKGPRDFFRFLRETQGRTGKPLLEEDLEKVLRNNASLREATLQALLRSRSLRRKEAEAGGILLVWAKLAGALLGNSQPATWEQVAEWALTLLGAGRKELLKLHSQLPADLYVPDLPLATVLSGIYHLFAALRKGLKEPCSPLTFQLHMRERHNEKLIAMSLVADDGSTLKSIPDEEELKLAVQHLAPWGMSCQSIARPEGGSYVILRLGVEAHAETRGADSAQSVGFSTRSAIREPHSELPR
ncbi:MAG: hypothetical protein HYW48_07455 [Deltaproteobacteria bacterium]|nr:hypothetical protein [Deltaproteobacteria bacterium]